MAQSGAMLGDMRQLVSGDAALDGAGDTVGSKEPRPPPTTDWPPTNQTLNRLSAERRCECGPRRP
jgi:hypothetical protein